MVNSDELLYVVDEFDEKVKPQPRHKVFKEGLWRRTAHVWIFNDKKQILCQKRSLKKDSSPGMWEPCVAGHLSPGDNYFTGAVREAREETGLEIETHHLNLLKIYKDHKYREYRGVFYCNWNVDPGQIMFEEDEIEEIKMIDISKLKKQLLDGKLENWVNYGYEHEMFAVLN